MGENSGSLHSYPNIPVVLEMNGAEDLEQLKVIKVSYSDPASIESADLAGAAKDILAFTRQGRHKTALQHNCRRAKQLSPQNIALIYKQLFTQQEPLEC
jgi:hypothetical protein